MAKKPKINADACIGCGLCANTCPDVFELGSDGKAHVKNQKGKCDLESVASACPVGAIALE